MAAIASPTRFAARRAFTLIEVLVVVGIIVLLIALLIVAVAAASNYAAAARTTVLMNSLVQGVERFRGDFGTLPPVLGANRNVLGEPANGDVAGLQNWFSFTTPAEYLLGYGSATEDGADGMGFRNPGPDAAWNSTLAGGGGTLGERRPNVLGQVYGPYLELGDNELIGSMDPNNGTVYTVNDALFAVHPKVILDYWGRPIRFYARGVNTGLDLGDVFLLRPWQMPPGAEAAGAPDATGSRATTLALKSASYAFFSSGPDRSFNATLRVDDPNDPANTAGTSSFNKDNLVEIGQ